MHGLQQTFQVMPLISKSTITDTFMRLQSEMHSFFILLIKLSREISDQQAMMGVDCKLRHVEMREFISPCLFFYIFYIKSFFSLWIDLLSLLGRDIIYVQPP